MNILYLADPNSIHDIKWMSFFSKSHTCFILVRQHHYELFNNAYCEELKLKYNINFVGTVEDFSIREFLKTRRTALEIKEHIKVNQIDLFHILYAEPNALWANFKKSFSVPMVLTTRGTDVLKTIPGFFNSYKPIKFLSAFFYKRAFHNFDHIVSTSIRQVSQIETLVGRSSNSSVIRTGVDVDRIKADTSSFGRKELQNKRYVLFPRAMRPLYQHELAVKAVNMLPSRILGQFVFVFVDKKSNNEAYTNEIKGLMDENLLVNYEWFENLNQQTLYETYKNAALVVMTPLSDGTPVSALETMLCKTPLLLPPLDYDEDIFGEGVQKFKSFDPVNLSSTIGRMLSEEDSLDLGLAYQNAMNLGDREREMNKLKAIYQQLISEASSD